MTECTGETTCIADAHFITCKGSPAGWLDWLLGLDRENQLIVIDKVREWRAVYRAHRAPTTVDRGVARIRENRHFYVCPSELRWTEATPLLWQDEGDQA